MVAQWNVAKLASRALLRMRGSDAHILLQGLITNDVAHLQHAPSLYAMLLNIKGRVVNDLLVYRSPNDESELLVECASAEAETLLKTLKRYKIRKKVAMELAEDILPAALYSTADMSANAPKFQDAFVQCPDPRLALMGSRLLLPKGVEATSDAIAEVDENHYNAFRYQLGVPEGTEDIPVENALPLECNLAFMNGVSFSKGCYIGQELTARTQHTGVIRKRILPVTLSSNGAKPGDEIFTSSSARPVGRLRGVSGTRALALLRVADALRDPQLRTSDNARSLVAHIPDWWPEDAKPKTEAEK